MARPSRPWYRTSRGQWFVQIGGKQIPLGVTDPKAEVEAWAAFRQMANNHPAGGVRTVAAVVAEYLEFVAPAVQARTLRGYRWYLRQFVARHGSEGLHAVAAESVEAGSLVESWSPTTRNNYLATIHGCLRWAGRPLKLRKPPKQSAGAESVIPEAVFRQCLHHCKGDYHAAILVLWNTGARPSEVRALTVESVDWEQRVARLSEHKTARHGRGDRLIYLNAEAFEAVTWQRQRYPSGWLFRSARGGPLSAQAFVMKFWRLAKLVGHPVTAKCFRHTLATRALAAGESDTIVAGLLGHSSTQMIHAHYAHVSAMGRQLKDAANRIGRAG